MTLMMTTMITFPWSDTFNGACPIYRSYEWPPTEFRKREALKVIKQYWDKLNCRDEDEDE